MRRRARVTRAGALGSAVVAGLVALGAVPAVPAGAAAGDRPPRRVASLHRHAMVSFGPFQVANFACTGSPQSYVVPAGASSVTARLVGGDGGDAESGIGGLAA